MYHPANRQTTRTAKMLQLAGDIAVASRGPGCRKTTVVTIGHSKYPDFIPTAALPKKFLAYISSICGAAKFFLRLAFGRTQNI
jgi:hypothetical protein